MGIVRDLYYAKKMSAGMKLPAPSSALLLKRQFLAGLMGGEKTFTGSVVSFTGRATSEITALTAAITPVQAGSGDPSPSNVRPITGYTGANIYVSPTQNHGDATTYTFDWTSAAGTIGGGDIEAISGKLTESVQYASVNGGFLAAGNGTFYKEAVFTSPAPERPDVFMCNYFATRKKVATGGTAEAIQNPEVMLFQLMGQNVRILIYTTKFASVSDFNAELSNTPMQIALSRATPVEYTITAQQVAALVGQNYIWADTGDVTVTVNI